MSLLGQPQEERPDFVEEIGRLRRELGNFMQLIAKGQAPASILSEITARKTRIAFLEEQQRATEKATVDLYDRRLRNLLREGMDRS